ncbi:UXX-star selenoprotein family 1 [Salidesulfovibrio onnuriiensis]|uniref:UXX-star selenoprotein family 1 n=1 Tax=Salidesulfovibrio onnuriiensis TaxID=2583823 RepID=UPI0011C8988D|nr:UXX-star (seleno)protein family 1 [Salidesulfovibrio onnuriiensis]
MPEQIIIYGKEHCPHTRRARDAYPEAEFIDVQASPENMDAMLRLSGGVRRVPVVVKDGVAEVGHNRGA